MKKKILLTFLIVVKVIASSTCDNTDKFKDSHTELIIKNLCTENSNAVEVIKQYQEAKNCKKLTETDSNEMMQLLNDDELVFIIGASSLNGDYATKEIKSRYKGRCK